MILIIIAGAAMRIWAATDNFWLDEVATYYLALQLDSPMDALVRVRLDHHILNTAYFAAIGDRHHWGIYRLLSIISGVAAMVLVSSITVRRGAVQRFMALLMCAVSYPLVHYSSEGRGYAPAICFSLCAVLILRAACERHSLPLRLLFVLSCILALLSQVTSLYPIAGMTAWSAYRVIRTSQRNRSKTKAEAVDFLATYLPIYAALAGMYVIMRQSGTTGGEIIPLPLVLMRTAAYLLGMPASGLWLTAATCAAAFFLSASFLTVYRKDLGRFLFYLFTIIIVPAATLVFNPRPYVYPRYFILTFPFAILLFCEWLDHLWQRGTAFRTAAITLVCLFVAGSSVHTARFLKSGRGQYFNAIQTICQHSEAETIAVSGDHDFRVGMMVNYYRRFFEPRKLVYYIPAHDLTAEGVDWYITHQISSGPALPEQLVLTDSVYKKIATFPFYGLSGMQWTLYRRDISIAN